MISASIGADLLRQLAQHGGARILVRIDAALRQLPSAGRALGVRQIGPPGDEHAARAGRTAPRRHCADTAAARPRSWHGAHGMGLMAWRCPARSWPAAGGRAISALTGTSMQPRAPQRCAPRRTIRSVVTGEAARRPARPPSRAAARFPPAARAWPRFPTRTAGSSITRSTARCGGRSGASPGSAVAGADRRTAAHGASVHRSTDASSGRWPANRSPRSAPSAPVAPT